PCAAAGPTCCMPAPPRPRPASSPSMSPRSAPAPTPWSASTWSAPWSWTPSGRGVLRDGGRDETVGGGLVLDPFPPTAVRGTAARVRRAEELEAREAAGPAGLPARVLAERGAVPLTALPHLAAIARQDLLPADGSVVRRTRTLAWSREAWEAAA